MERKNKLIILVVVGLVIMMLVSVVYAASMPVLHERDGQEIGQTVGNLATSEPGANNLKNLAHYQIFGIDLVVYIGAIALILLIFVASITSLNKHILVKRGKRIPPQWHHRIAIFAIVLIILHVVVQYI